MLSEEKTKAQGRSKAKPKPDPKPYDADEVARLLAKMFGDRARGADELDLPTALL